MAWSDKDDAIDWQAYFHLRNRLVVAAMHWDGNVARPDRQPYEGHAQTPSVP